MLDNSMFLNVMNTIGIEINDEIKDGKFSRLIIKKEEMIINMILSFPKILSVDTVVFLRRKLTDFFVSDNMYNKINIEIQYDDCTIEENKLFEYYDYILSVFEVKRARFSFLKLLNKSFVNGNIKVYVANDDEIPTVEPLLSDINQIFKLYGLNSKCVVEVSNFEVSTQSLIEDRIQKEDERIMKQQQYYNNLNTNEEKPQQKVQKQPKMKAKLNGKVLPISEIPATEVQLIEYVQRNEKAEFVILGDLISTEIKDIKSTKSGT